ncbi:MAG: peptidylprolyl isomerase [Rhodobacteraceae bacterium]|nr:peptidylprolyl isomerase [Paracoccaceae bacterium]
MRKHLTFLPSLAFMVLMALPAGAEPDANTVVARVNGQDITLGHMIISRATLPEKYRSLPVDVLYNAILDQLIQQETLRQSLGGHMPGSIALQLENEKRSLLAAEAIESVLAGVDDEDSVLEAYNAKYSTGFGEDEYHAAHILVETEEEAKQIKVDLDAGTDFADMAREKSTGPSGPNGGDLGWFSAGAMVPEFEEAVVGMDVGGISDPVQTQFGWHLIILNEKRQKAAPTLEAVRADLIGQLQEDAVEARIEELTVAATIERPEVEGLLPNLILDLELIED